MRVRIWAVAWAALGRVQRAVDRMAFYAEERLFLAERNADRRAGSQTDTPDGTASPSGVGVGHVPRKTPYRELK